MKKLFKHLKEIDRVQKKFVENTGKESEVIARERDMVTRKIEKLTGLKLHN